MSATKHWVGICVGGIDWRARVEFTTNDDWSLEYVEPDDPFISPTIECEGLDVLGALVDGEWRSFRHLAEAKINATMEDLLDARAAELRAIWA